jgi:hypothetical protein
MTLTERLDAVMRERSLLPNTRSTYHSWQWLFPSARLIRRVLHGEFAFENRQTMEAA